MDLGGTGHLRRCFSIPVESILLLLGSSNKGILVRRSPIHTVAPSASAPFTNLQCCAFHECSAICTVAPSTLRHSPISTVAPHQVHHSPISSIAPSTSVAQIYTVAPSESAPFTNLQYYTFYKGCTNLHCCASLVAPFYSVAPFVSYYSVPCDYATRQFYIINNFATDVNTPCRKFNCIIEM